MRGRHLLSFKILEHQARQVAHELLVAVDCGLQGSRDRIVKFEGQ